MPGLAVRLAAERESGRKGTLLAADPDLWLVAAYALARFEGDGADSRGALERALLTPAGRGRALVPTVFGRLAPDYPELVPVAATYLQSLDVSG